MVHHQLFVIKLLVVYELLEHSKWPFETISILGTCPDSGNVQLLVLCMLGCTDRGVAASDPNYWASQRWTELLGHISVGWWLTVDGFMDQLLLFKLVLFVGCYPLSFILASTTVLVEPLNLGLVRQRIQPSLWLGFGLNQPHYYIPPGRGNPGMILWVSYPAKTMIFGSHLRGFCVSKSLLSWWKLAQNSRCLSMFVGVRSY